MLDPILTKNSAGLTILRIPMPGVASLTAMVLANTGSRFESPAQQGIAHFFEHMVFKGTEKYPMAHDIAQTLDSLGAVSNAFTGKEYTGYYVKCAADKLNIALDVLSDMVLSPRLRQEDIDRERGVIIEEINMYEDTPMQNIENVFEQLLFAGSGLEHDIIGNKKTVGGINRDDFLDFIGRYYGLANLLVVLAGDKKTLTDPQTEDMINTMFAKKTQDRNGHWQHGLAKQQLQIAHSDRLKVVTKKTEQTHLMLGWPGVKRNDPRRYALMLLSVIMGGNMSSRLFTEVREKRGLCYYVNAQAEHYHDNGTLVAAAGVDPGRVHEAIKVIQEECQLIADRQKPITATELNHAKDYVSGTMLLSLEDSRSVAQFFGFRQLLSGKILTPEEILAKVEAVTLEEVMKVGQELMLPDQTRLALIGPFETKAFTQYVTS